MKERFLHTWKQVKNKFVKPKLFWYAGSWRREGNLPVWRRGPTIHLGKYKDYTTKYNYAKLVSAEWTDIGRKNHPLLSKLFKPVYQLPIWMAFHFYNRDISYKVKWSDDDFRFEFPAHVTLVFFGFAISVTAYIPKNGDSDWTCNDDYWESLLTYNHYKGDLKKTSEAMGCWNRPGDSNFRFRFQPRFLKDEKDREVLEEIQKKQLKKLNKREGQLEKVL